MKFLRIGICALAVFGVATHGAVEEWARAVLETGAGLLFVSWAIQEYFTNREIVLSPLLPPLLALGLVALGQIVFHGTASPYDTRLELQLLLTYAIVLFLATQAFRTADHWRGFVWFVMFFAFIVAIFGILQHLTFNGKLYWFRAMRYGGIPFGPYVNRNHFAGFAELVIPVALVPLVLGKVRRERWLAVAIFALLPIVALFLSASRGGIVSFAAEIVVLTLLMALRRAGGRHVLAGGVVFLLAFMLVSWLGVRQMLERFSSMQSLEVSVGKRATMRHDAWHIFRDHPWTGTGLGTLPIVFPAYESLYDGKVVNHAHNDYLEMLADTGVLGAFCCACFLGVLFFCSLKQLLVTDKSFAAALHLSGLVACCGFLVHSLVDFNLHMPGNALLFFLMAHLATAQIPRSPANRHSRPSPAAQTKSLIDKSLTAV
ncbi:MAG TPA: O-antigen ligase family protein [Candidatus Acidoferrum sp.]